MRPGWAVDWRGARLRMGVVQHDALSDPALAN